MVSRDQSHATSRALHTSRPKAGARRRWVWLGFIAVIVGVYQAYAWWISPEHRIALFLTAARRSDTAAMVSLADPAEVKRLGLTPAKLSAILEDACGLSGALLPGDPQPIPYEPPQSRYNRAVRVTLHGDDGRPLTQVTGRPSGHAVVIAYKTDAGWRIALSRYIQSVLIARTGRLEWRGDYTALCARHFVTAELYLPEDDKWVSATGTD